MTSQFFSTFNFLSEIQTIAVSCYIFLIITTYIEMAYFVPILGFYIVQHFFRSILCEEISTKYGQIATSVYGSKWYCLTKEGKRSVFNIMMMSQKPKTISLGGFTCLTLERFAAVSVLKKMLSVWISSF